MINTLLTRSLRCLPPARQVVIVALVGVIGPAANSWADPILITRQSTKIEARFFNFFVGAEATGFQHVSFDLGGSRLSDSITLTVNGTTAATVGATASSMLSPAEMTASFTTVSTSSGDWTASTYALSSTSFTVLEPVAFEFSGSQSSVGYNSVFAFLEVVGSPFGSPFKVRAEFFPGAAPSSLFQTGVLEPGDYEFFAGASTAAGEVDFVGGVGFPSSSTEFNTRLGFTPVAPIPEPTSLLLFGTGFVALVTRTWKATRNVID